MTSLIKVSDYLVQRLAEFGVRHTFMITGGGAMHLNDSFGRCKKIKLIFNHHEQACAMAAEGYARAKGQLGVVCVTTGPGGLNCLSGLMGAWTDSVPLLFISGQVKAQTMLSTCPQVKLRQLGDQEVDIISVVRSLTKFAQTIYHPHEIDVILAQAVTTALTGRPGPVWIDLPMNVQGAMLRRQDILPGTWPTKRRPVFGDLHVLAKAVKYLSQAQRPLLVIGHGVRLAQQMNELRILMKQVPIPVATSFNGMDLVAYHHPLMVGRIGTIGQRAANKALQAADVILFLGTRNNVRQISYNWENFAPQAYKIVVDIDPAELAKPTLRPDLKLNLDLKQVLPYLRKALAKLKLSLPHLHAWKTWLKQCQGWKKRYTPLSEFPSCPQAKVHPYFFIDQLSSYLKKSAVIVTANGTASVACFQALANKLGQRIIFNSGCASMGYGLPAAIGAAIGLKRAVICLEGDGSIMMNLQELQTVKTYHLPLKIFIFNNHSYHSIYQTQHNFFGNHLTGCHPASGVECPDFVKVGQAFGIKAIKISHQREMKAKLDWVLNCAGPIICELDCTMDYIFAPKLGSQRLADGKIISGRLEAMMPPRND